MLLRLKNKKVNCRKLDRNLKTNDQIKGKECRLVGINNEQIGVVPLFKAKEQAKKLNLDLVEISSISSPIVCKIMDYGKHKFEQQKKEDEKRKHQKIGELRELRLHPDIQVNDLNVKIRQIKGFIEHKNKVRVVVVFKGRENKHIELGWKLLEKIIADLKGLVVIEYQPRLEANRMFLVLAPPKVKPQRSLEK